MSDVKRYDQMFLDPITGRMATLKVVLAAAHDAKVAALEAENAKLRAELERRVPGDHTEQALVMVPVKPTQAMISAGWNVGLMGMDRDGPQAIYAAMLAAAPATATAQGVNQQLREALAALIADYDGEIHNEYDGTSMLDGLLAKINYAREALAAAQEVK